MITLRFVTCHDPVSDTIRRGEMGFWASHVEALMPDGTLLGAHYDGGVAARPRDYDKGKWSKELYVRVPCDPAQVQAFEDFLRAQIGKPYDMGAIGEMAVGMLTGEDPDWPQKPSWICSALQTAALLEAKVLKAAPASVRLATPRDVLMALSGLVEIGQPQTPKGAPAKLFERVVQPKAFIEA